MQKTMWYLERLATSAAAVAVAAALATPGAAQERLYDLPDSLDGSGVGTVFTMTNGTDPDRGNEVVAFHRLDDGTLSVAGYFPTGGVGSGPAPTSTVFGVPVPANADGLGSQGGLLLTDPNDDGSRLLFAVNAGSNSITCFRVEDDADGATLSQPTTVASRGVFPASLAVAR